MAVIDNVVRVTTNRAGAVTDLVTRLQSADTGQVVNIADQHIPANLVRSTFLGEGINVPTGTVSNTNQITAEVSVGETHIYRSTATSGTQAAAITNAEGVRNAATDVIWHQGDSAVLLPVASATDANAWHFDARLYLYTGTNQTTAGATTNDDWTLISDAAAMGVTALTTVDQGDTLARSLTIGGTTYRLPASVAASDLSITRTTVSGTVPANTNGVHQVAGVTLTQASAANYIVYLGGARLLPSATLATTTPTAGTYGISGGNLYLNFGSATGNALDVVAVLETLSS